MKNALMNSKKLACAAALATLAVVAAPCPCAAGDISAIFPVDEAGARISSPVSSAEAPLASGSVVRFCVRMAKRAAGDNPWRLHYVGGGSEALARRNNPFQIGIYVSGELAYAAFEVEIPRELYTDFVFRYDVQPGDFALPVVLAAGQDDPRPANASLCRDWEYHVKPSSLDAWRIDDSTDGGEAATAVAGFAFAAAGVVSEFDCDLREAGFYVRTIGFDDGESDDAWRTLRPGVTQTGLVHVDSAPMKAMTLYVWSMDESVVTVDGEPSSIHFSATQQETRNVAVIEVKEGQQDYPISFSSDGDALGKGTTLVLSGSGDFSYYVGTGGRHDDYLTATVRVREPRVYSIVYEGLKGAAHSNPETYVEGTAVTLAAPEAVEHWTFAGWTPGAITATTTGDLTVTANWTLTDLPLPTVSPADGSFFVEDSCEVALSCEIEGAKIYFTTNGTSPRTTAKFLYTEPFMIDRTTTVKAVAVCGSVKSELATAVITKKILTLAEVLGLDQVSNVTVTTGGAADWRSVRDFTAASGLSARSGKLADAVDGDWTESWMETSVEGPGTFTFKWRVDCEKDDYDEVSWDHLAVFVDGEERVRIDGTTGWEAQTIVLETEGSHAIRWVFTKDTEPNDAYSGEDCAWVADCVWTPKGADEVMIMPATGGSSFVIPVDWFKKYPTLGGTTVAEWQSIAEGAGGKTDASGVAMPVWNDYVAGTDPTNAQSKFTAKIEMNDGASRSRGRRRSSRG